MLCQLLWAALVAPTEAGHTVYFIIIIISIVHALAGQPSLLYTLPGKEHKRPILKLQG